ncbi:hypothetical protein PIB30_036308 [Stylosanthes scabra]|uniref:Transposase-associated domain-containing protein n=1 Tax=Stylosanthes scabra TaxID=79078 RepID=A0ABU6SDK3_9FABA|nr:hypothetical protein [Stylosanthes scabra]
MAARGTEADVPTTFDDDDAKKGGQLTTTKHRSPGTPLPLSLFQRCRTATKRSVAPLSATTVAATRVVAAGLLRLEPPPPLLCSCSKCHLLNWIGPEEMTLHLYRNRFNPGYWIWTSLGKVNVDNINHFETGAQRRSKRGSRRANLNREDEFGDVNSEDNQEQYNEMIIKMQRQMAVFYNPLRPGSSATVGGSGCSTTLLLPPRLPPRQPNHPPSDDDDDYEDA